MNQGTHPPDLRELWAQFPLALCINLREREDRFREARAELKAAGLERVTFVRTERQPDRDKAIIDAHMACLRHGLAQGASTFLVFEDDVQFQAGYEAGLERSIRFMRSRNDWRIFYFGGFIFRKFERTEGHILRGAVLTTHAYVIRAEFAREVLARRPYCTGMSIDLFYSALLGDQAFVHVDPLLCIQRPSASDGTWDKRSLNKEGWLGNAMLFTALDGEAQRKFEKFSWAEKRRIRNGVLFFRFYRWLQQRRLAKSEARGRVTGVAPVTDDGPPALIQEEAM